MHKKSVNKKNTAGILASAFVLAALLFASCATVETADNADDQGLVIRGSEQDPGKLVKNQLLSVTVPVEDPVFLECSNWSKIRTVTDFLDEIEGHRDFTNDEKSDLLSFFFKELPVNAEDGIARHVLIGDYFENGTPLEIRIGIFTPGGEAAIANDKAVVFLTNIVRAPDGTLKKTEGAFISLDINASLVFGLKDGFLSNARNIPAEPFPEKDEINSMEPVERLIFAQAMLRDNDLSNDSYAAELAAGLISESTEMPAVMIFAMIMKYNYLVSVEDVNGAERIWEEILEYSVNVPGDMTPENLQQLNGESLYMLKALLSEA